MSIERTDFSSNGIDRGVQSRAVRANKAALGDYQAKLAAAGVELKWPELRAL